MQHTKVLPARRLVPPIAVGLSLALAITACGGGGNGESGSAGGDQSTRLVVAFPQEPADWDHVQSSATAIKALVMHNILEPLLEKQEDGSLTPTSPSTR